MLDRPVLFGNLLSGAGWLLLLAALGPWPLALIGAGYVVISSVFLAAVYGRARLTRPQELRAWATPWLLAVAVWIVVLGGMEGGSTWPLSLVFGLVLGTGCFLAWQLTALAVRQFIAWRSPRRTGS